MKKIPAARRAVNAARRARRRLAAEQEKEERHQGDRGDPVGEILEAAGARDVHTWDEGYAPGMGIHEMGTARMGRDPKSSVLNEWNQCHDVPNLLVTDGACMASSACQNPSLTYMALTARATTRVIDRMKNGSL